MYVKFYLKLTDTSSRLLTLLREVVMSSTRASELGFLPLMSAKSPIIGMRELQRISSAQLDELKHTGPTILCSGGVKRAVIIDFDQYMLMQNRFDEMLGVSARFLSFLPKIPSGYALEVKRLQLEVEGTLKKIVAESPEVSPVASMLDTLLNLGNMLFGQSADSKELNLGLKNEASKNSKKIGKKSGQSFRTNQE